MSTMETLEQLLKELPEERLREVLQFTQFILWQREHDDWQRYSLQQFAKAYGDNEPEYLLEDVKRGRNE